MVILLSWNSNILLIFYNYWTNIRYQLSNPAVTPSANKTASSKATEKNCQQISLQSNLLLHLKTKNLELRWQRCFSIEPFNIWTWRRRALSFVKNGSNSPQLGKFNVKETEVIGLEFSCWSCHPTDHPTPQKPRKTPYKPWWQKMQQFFPIW